MKTVQQSPELLAPAGDWDALRAAAANGADAVYFGLSRFNARHRATNFEPYELPEILEFLHTRNIKGFVTLNTLIFSDELPAIAEYLQAIATAGVDAVIVQDLGLARLIRSMVPALPIHASTQMTLTEPRGVAFAKEHLGIARAVLARELSIEDIRKVAAATDVPLEVFVHGALCVAYSGQCLTSEALGGRSANRGQCAQACRLPYEMLVDGQKRDLGDRAYLLSPQDLAGYDQITALTEAGVISFKIEGRLKGPHYVAATTQTYRKAIDTAVAKKAYKIDKHELRDLEQTFSRGFVPGFLEGVNHQKLVRGRVPKSRGIRVGKVVNISQKGHVRIELIEADPTLLKPGDGIVFDLGKPAEKEPGGRIWGIEHFGRFAEMRFEPESIQPDMIPLQSTVWKTDDPELRKRLDHTFHNDPIPQRVPLQVIVQGQIGAKLTIRVEDPDGHSASATWAGPLELARKHPLTEASFREQFDRLGETPFVVGAIRLELPPDVMVPKSIINDLRRQAIETLIAARKVLPTRPIDKNALAEIRKSIRQRVSTEPLATQPHLTVLARTMEQVEAVIDWQAQHHQIDMVYCDFEDTRRYREAVPLCRGKGMPVGLATLRILKPGEDGFLKPILGTDPDAILIRNLASLAFFREQTPNIPLVADFSLNIANEITADLLMQQGFARLVPSYDLNWEQFAELIQHADPRWFEPVIHQHMPMFHNEFCVFAAYLSNGKDYRDCGRPCDRHQVDFRDHVGSIFPVIPDVGCRNTVYNSVPQSAAEYLGRMKELGIRNFRIDLLRETPEEVVKLLGHYHRVIAGLEDGKDSWKHLRALNQLGVTRGTLNLL